MNGLAALAASVLVALAPLPQGAPPHTSLGIDIWGQPSRSAEHAGRPLERTLGIFRSTKRAARLPVGGSGLTQPLSVVAAKLSGSPGKLLVGLTRRVDTPAGRLYLVPTDRGWACMQASSFETCHRGLLAQGITWNLYSTQAGLTVVGLAADGVARVTLTYGTTQHTATLHDNVFYVTRPLTLTSAQHLPPLGRLVVSYRDPSRPPAQVAVH